MDREGAFKVCIFGDESLGKTTFVNRYLPKVFDESIKMTVGADFYVKDLEIEGKNILLRIWDLGGEQRFRVLLRSFAKGADGGIFMFDIARYRSLRNIDDWLSIFETYVIFEENVLLVRKLLPIIMVGVLTDGENKRSVSVEEAVKFAKSRNLNGYIECNLKTGKYVEEVFGDLTRHPRNHGIEVPEKNGIDSSEEFSSKTGQNVDKIFEVMTDLILKRMEGGDYIRSKKETYILNKMMSKEEYFSHEKYISDEEMDKILDNIQTERGHYDILLVEDDLATIRLLTNYFESKDLTCKGVVSGTKALEELKYNTPKLILTDIIHPAPNGYDLCKQIKSNQKLKNIPVFFCTAIPGSEVEKHLAETKADGYINKPFKFSDFDGILDLLGSNSVKEVEIRQQQYEVKMKDLDNMRHSDIKPKKPISKVPIPKPKLKIFSEWKSRLVRGKKKKKKKNKGWEIICPMCGARGKQYFKKVENKSKIVSYIVTIPMYAKNHVCKRCGYEF